MTRSPIGMSPAVRCCSALRFESRALLLDMDGTLVDSEEFNQRTIRSWFAKRGWPASDELLRGFLGRRADDVLSTTPGPWSKFPVSELVTDMLSLMEGATPPGLAAGARELLRLPQRKALVTSANHYWVNTCLGTEVARFETVVTRDEVTHGKPHPEPYRLASQLLELDPATCIAVEDAPAGVASALAANVGLVIGVQGHFSQDLSAAHVVVSSLLEIPELL